ncbi:MAG: hypothetical protein M1289_02815 [Patescibacteria group bacterium]|nr:hypothetical protein [Patescibacteria group bacterium]
MSQTIAVSAKTINTIQERLDELTREIKAIKARIFEEEPLYGSDEWWERSEKKADEDIKTGRYTVLHNKKGLKSYLDSLKTS